MANETVARKGFFFNQDNCIGCRTCQIACKDKNDNEIGVIFRHVEDYEVGTYPAVKGFHYAATCNHCENPACVEVCPNEATYVNEADGTVQHDDSKCIGCEYCVKACPYGHPQLVESLHVVHRCNACIQLREAGEKPACVAACPMRALEFCDIEELRAAHPEGVNELPFLPSASQTNPSVVIAPKEAATEAGAVPVVL